MYINNKILVGKNDTSETVLLTNMACRHGLITGASGTGKTVTLKVLAESFSSAGVPVLLTDIKGDVSGMCVAGCINDKLKERLDNLKIDNFTFTDFPTHFWDVYGTLGHPIRTTIDNIGYELLARMLGLTEAQEGVLAIVFKIAEDKNLKIVDLKDLRLLLQYIGENRKEYTLEYGNVTLQSIGAIQRNLLMLESEGGDYFFGEPTLNIKDFIKFSATNGNGYINILDSTTLVKKPNLYSSFLLWLLNELYGVLPEVGDLDKPKLVLFFDEAHLIFDNMPDHIISNIVQIVKLIRSKGVGLYFVSQSPKDIPDEVLAQLQNKVQHALHAYTPSEEKIVNAAANSFRPNPNFDTKEAIKSLATGEALVSFLQDNGEPSITERVTILPPQSSMSTIDNTIRLNVLNNSLFKGKYDTRLENVSAFEVLTEEIEKGKQAEIYQQQLKEQEKLNKKNSKQKKSKSEKALDKMTNSAMNTIGRKIGNSIFKVFK